MKSALIWIVSAAIAAQSAWAASTEKKTADQYWKESGFTLADAETYIQPQLCDSTEARFMACLAGLNEASSADPKPYLFVAENEVLTGNPKYAKILASFGPIVAVEYKGEPITSSHGIAAYWEGKKQERDVRLLALHTIFGLGKASSVNFAAMFSFLKENYHAPRNEFSIAGLLVNGYLKATFDPHTHLDPNAQLIDRANSNDDILTGIGIKLRLAPKHLLVETPVVDSPALAAGIRAHDEILRVNGASVQGLEADEVVKLIRGPIGTSVKLDLLRKGQALSITVVRSTIHSPNVVGELLTDAGIPIGYIKLAAFSSDASCKDVGDQILALQKKGARALILDLRNNPGGLLRQAVCIGGLFLGDNKIVVKVKDLERGHMESIKPKQKQITRLPMLTLINSGSASASEVVSGALQDHQRSWIAGARSYGKGTVQGQVIDGSIPKIIHPANSTDGVILYKTLQRFYQPSGRTNQVVGILPDFSIDPVPNATEDNRFALHEADLFTNALPPVGPTWKQPRPVEVQKIQSCAAKNGVADQLYQKRMEDAPIAPDYQILKAEDLVKCAL